jgi:hypothetical protein
MRTTVAILVLLAAGGLAAGAVNDSLEFVYDCFIARFADGNPAWKTEITLEADLSSLSNGLHQLGFRVQDNSNRWSDIAWLPVQVQDATTLIPNPASLPVTDAASRLRWLYRASEVWETGGKDIVRAFDEGVLPVAHQRAPFYVMDYLPGTDVGEIVFQLVEAGQLSARGEDRREDFAGGPDLMGALSDGLDLYIAPILHRTVPEPVQFVSNRAVVDPNDRTLRIEFPHANAECDRCACCKRNIMLNGTPDEDVLVYVGEGYSDRCPAGYADVVFAKDALQTYCREQNISYIPYRTFHDVRRSLELLDRKSFV